MEISVPSLNLIALAPEIVVLVTALAVMVVDLLLAQEQKQRLAWLSLVGIVLAAAVSYYIWDGSNPSVQAMIAADGYALFLKLVVLVAGALTILFSVEYASATNLAQGEYYTLLLLSILGMMLTAGAINLMTIFLGMEILSIALYILVGLRRNEPRSGEAAIKYFLLGAFASSFLLYGMALIYGQTGSTALSAVQAFTSSTSGPPPALLLVGLGLMIVGFGFKTALVPFHMWTPDAYDGAPTSVTAFMSVGAKAAGFAALGRIALQAMGSLHGEWMWILAVLSALTMTVGTLGSLRQHNLKRMLAYSSIAHAGYILVGISAGNEAGTSGVLFYLFAYAFMNIGAFAALIAACDWHNGKELEPTLDRLAGLAARKPGVATTMSLFLLSLAGIPPLAGFLGKLYVFSAAVQGNLAWLAIVGVLNSTVGAYVYLRVIVVMFMQEGKATTTGGQTAFPVLHVGLGLAAMASVLLGLWPAPIMDLARLTIAALMGS